MLVKLLFLLNPGSQYVWPNVTFFPSSSRHPLEKEPRKVKGVPTLTCQLKCAYALCLASALAVVF